MHLPHVGQKLAGRLSLTQQVAILSLVPIVALGFILAHVLQSQIVTRTLADASQSAQLIARIGIQPRLSPRQLRSGLTAKGVRELDQQLSARSVTHDLARIKIWNAQHEVVYSDDHRLIGRTLVPSDELRHALAGRANTAAVVNPRPHSETAEEVGLGELVEVYVPLRFTSSGPPAGAFEIYLSYRPIAAALTSDKRTIALLVSIGLFLLWAILFRIVARAARRLRLQSEENYHLAHYDPLTGLPNRTLFIERLADSLRRGEPHTGMTAVLLIDLDGFKEINNSLGEPTGDHVLCEVARRLQTDLGEGSLVARLGGDEYAVLCPRTEGVHGALATAAALQSSLEAPIVLDGVALSVEASIGIAVMREHAENLDTLLQRADVALARAKSHRSRIEVFSPERDSFDPTRLLLLGQVRLALEREELVLHYQPKVDLKTRRITGVEALLRWNHSERGLLPPLQFIPLVEQTALVAPLTTYVIGAALRQMVAWRELGLELQMSVNLSARNLLDPGLAVEIEDLLRQHGIPPSQLVVEVTESATMADPERAEGVLRALRSAGVGVSIDDFGTGNASIAYLTKLPASEIKIDRSFVTHIGEDERAEAIVRSTIDLARHLDLHVVAEGVETQAALEHLIELGCDTAQGYLFARPLPAEDLTEQLMESNHSPTGPLGGGGPELRPVSARGRSVVARDRA
jgi:diguanylate cyclase (GGDEF)-like protein